MALVIGAFIMAFIALALIIFVGSWFFVERSGFLNQNFVYNVIQATGDYSSTGQVSNSIIYVNPTVSTPPTTDVTITLNSDVNNKAGQILYIVNQTTLNTIKVRVATGAGVTMTNNVYASLYTLAAGRTAIFTLYSDNAWVYSGTTNYG